MKVICEMICHYGKEYMEKALMSVSPFVDKIIVLYSATPSQGHPTDAKCPETREELMAIARKFPKTEWLDCIDVGNEGEHRARIFNYTTGYDVLVLCDPDEVYDPIDLPRCIEEVSKSNVRFHKIEGFIHFWKSHEWFLDDGFRPMRFINLHNTGGETEIKCKIYHFSYCQRLELHEYKWKVSGHKDELRPEWFDIFKNWTPENQLNYLHPTTKGVWGSAVRFIGKLPYNL